ncbi:hypothetical protein BDZ91DRAFT_53120 [Kalaharituber pfeilii]|nr:hypothetical protein BDZ91DRAFT_53120 [Kalaharituber pfeilii]
MGFEYFYFVKFQFLSFLDHSVFSFKCCIFRSYICTLYSVLGVQGHNFVPFISNLTYAIVSSLVTVWCNLKQSFYFYFNFLAGEITWSRKPILRQ